MRIKWAYYRIAMKKTHILNSNYYLPFFNRCVEKDQCKNPGASKFNSDRDGFDTENICANEEHICCAENFNELTDKECSDYSNAGYRLGIQLLVKVY